MDDLAKLLQQTEDALRAAQTSTKRRQEETGRLLGTARSVIGSGLMQLGYVSRPGGYTEGQSRDLDILFWPSAEHLSIGLRRPNPDATSFDIEGGGVGPYATLTVVDGRHWQLTSRWLPMPLHILDTQDADARAALVRAVVEARCRQLAAEMNAPPAPPEIAPLQLSPQQQAALTQRTAWLLRELKRVDPESFNWLTFVRHAASTELVQHSDISATQNPETGAPVLCVLGLLNSLIGPDSPHRVALDVHGMPQIIPR